MMTWMAWGMASFAFSCWKFTPHFSTAICIFLQFILISIIRVCQLSILNWSPPFYNFHKKFRIAVHDIKIFNKSFYYLVAVFLVWYLNNIISKLLKNIRIYHVQFVIFLSWRKNIQLLTLWLLFAEVFSCIYEWNWRIYELLDLGLNYL